MSKGKRVKKNRTGGFQHKEKRQRTVQYRREKDQIRISNAEIEMLNAEIASYEARQKRF